MREHGTHACYVWGPESGPGDGCRCEPCRAANTAYEKARAQRIAPAYVSAANARAHVRFLSDHGVGLKRIVAVGGVSQGTLWKLMYGKDGKPSKRIRRSTEQKILAVTPADAADGAPIDAGGTWENVAVLLERGWTKVAIARALGQTGPGLQLGSDKVTAGNARAVAELLSQPVPPKRTRWGVIEVDEPYEEEDEPGSSWPDDLPRPPKVDLTAEPWRADAACRLPNVPLWIFFPGRADNVTSEAAKEVCARCAVRDECLDAHLDERVGVWGGTTEKERRRIRLERQATDDEREKVAS